MLEQGEGYSVDIRKTANPGDYAASLERTVFRRNPILQITDSYAEQGKFTEGPQSTVRELGNERIQFLFLPKDKLIRGTHAAGGLEIMVLPDDFESKHPAEKTWELLHRYMSLLLKRSNSRDNPGLLIQLLRMDIALAETIRPGASRLGIFKGKERQELLKLANRIEYESRMKISGIY